MKDSYESKIPNIMRKCLKSLQLKVLSNVSKILIESKVSICDFSCCDGDYNVWMALFNKQGSIATCVPQCCG